MSNPRVRREKRMRDGFINILKMVFNVLKMVS